MRLKDGDAGDGGDDGGDGDEKDDSGENSGGNGGGGGDAESAAGAEGEEKVGGCLPASTLNCLLRLSLSRRVCCPLKTSPSCPLACFSWWWCYRRPTHGELVLHAW